MIPKIAFNAFMRRREKLSSAPYRLSCGFQKPKGEAQANELVRRAEPNLQGPIHSSRGTCACSWLR
jgi:hypothetical protein